MIERIAERSPTSILPFARLRRRTSFFHSSILALLIISLVLIGCSSTRAPLNPAPSENSAEAQFVRRISPFEVRGADGEPYRFPFLGGLNVPRPQLVDIDGDDDLDLFLQETTGRVAFFENTGTPSDPAFTWRTAKYRDLDVGEWYRFDDLDDDGDFDLFAEQPYSYIRYYQNTGTPEAPHFELTVDTLRDASGEPIFSDRQNIPNVNDIDCDGRPDLFIGRLDGTITRYEAVSRAPGATPRFELVTENFEGIRIVGALSKPGGGPPRRFLPNGGLGGPSAGRAPGGTLHGANTMAFADVDGDGDIDLLWGDYFEPGLLLIENTGSCKAPILTSEPQPFPPSNPLATSGYNAPTLGDLDAYGDLDLLVGVIGGAFDPSSTAKENLYYFEKTDAGRFQLRTRRFLDGIDVGSESAPAVGDLGGDGNLDLLVGSKISNEGTEAGRLLVFENEGTGGQPAFRLTGTLDAKPGYNLAPTLGDLDADGDLDLLVGTWNDGIAYYRNDGAGNFSLVDAQFVALKRGSHASPALADLDGDGDLDLLVGETSGTLSFFRNTGTPQNPRFERVSEAYADLDLGRRTAPAFTDFDGDGDSDLVVGTEEQLVLFRNVGTPRRPEFERDSTFALPGYQPGLLAPTFTDLDGDGALDLFVGTNRGGVLFYERRAR